MSSKFYNMKAQILFQGSILEEVIAIKNLWEKNNETILDVYFHSSKQNRIIDAAYIKSLEDLNTGTVYENISDFINEFNPTSETVIASDNEATSAESDLNPLKDIKNDLIILSFLSRLSPDSSDVKIREIINFIETQKPETKPLDEQYIKIFLNNLNADEKSFFESLENLDNKNVEEATEFLKECIKVTAIDGMISYIEKKYLAEIFQTFRNHCINPDVEF